MKINLKGSFSHWSVIVCMTSAATFTIIVVNKDHAQWLPAEVDGEQSQGHFSENM